MHGIVLAILLSLSVEDPTFKFLGKHKPHALDKATADLVRKAGSEYAEWSFRGSFRRLLDAARPELKRHAYHELKNPAYTHIFFIRNRGFEDIVVFLPDKRTRRADSGFQTAKGWVTVILQRPRKALGAQSDSK